MEKFKIISLNMYALYYFESIYCWQDWKNNYLVNTKTKDLNW